MVLRSRHRSVVRRLLGIVSERDGKSDEALKYYHRALESGPPEDMKKPIVDAMQRLLQKTGKTAPPLPQSR